MAGFTYSGLKTAIQDYVDSSETTFVNNLNIIIEQAEERILKGVWLDNFKKNVTGTATSDTPYLGMPTDFLAPFSLAVIDSNTYHYLNLKQVSFMRSYKPTTTGAVTGRPKYYAEFDSDSFIIAPTPDSNYTFELHYFYRPASLTAAGDSGQTWLSENAPIALLYASLTEASIFLKMDPAETGLYNQRFEDALARLKNTAEGAGTQSQYRYDQVRIPIT
jgi:hypothetical protein|tara:strand:- start:126 stop:782 length:657 start_codon:yes stop_codon:yes gene_type:complete